jgi:hypothetical protein
MVDNAIYQILKDSKSITSCSNANMFTVVAAQNDLTNYLVIYVIDTIAENTKDGSALYTVRVQIDMFHSEKSQADSLATQVRANLDRYRGTTGGYVIDKIIFEDERSGFDFERRIYKVSHDYMVRLHR